MLKLIAVWRRILQVHLVDGTYELFRHFYALPSARDARGREVAAVRGILRSLLGMLTDGATHIGSGFNRIRPLVAHLLAGHSQPVVLRNRSPGAQHGPSRMFLPLHCRHNLFQRCAAFTLEHRDHRAGLAAFARGTDFSRGGGYGRLFRLGSLLLRGWLRRRHVGRV